MPAEMDPMIADLRRLEELIPLELQHVHTQEEANQRAGGHLYGGGLYRRALEQWLVTFIGDETRVCARHGILGVRDLSAELAKGGSMQAAARQMLDEGLPRLDRLFFSGVYDSFAALCSAVDWATRALPAELATCAYRPADEFKANTMELAAMLSGTVDTVFGPMIQMPDVLPEELR